MKGKRERDPENEVVLFSTSFPGSPFFPYPGAGKGRRKSLGTRLKREGSVNLYFGETFSMPLSLCLVKPPTILSVSTLFISMSLISTSVTSMSESIPCGPGPASSSSPSLSQVPLSSSSSRSMGDWQGEVPSEADGELVTTSLWGVFWMGDGCELSLTCSAGVALSKGQKIKIYDLEQQISVEKTIPK